MRFVLITLLALTPATALAQTANPPAARAAPPAPAATPATPTTPRGTRAPTPLDAAIARGAEAYRQRQFDVAGTAFREAAGLDARNALPQVYLGYVAAARGDAASALGAFREAARIAQAQGDDLNRGRALAGIAIVNESQTRWDDARGTWTEYSTFGDAHPAVTFPAVGRSRNEAIGRRGTIETEYAPVRERIAERQRINASGQNNQAPPGMTVAPVAPGTVPSGTVVVPAGRTSR